MKFFYIFSALSPKEKREFGKYLAQKHAEQSMICRAYRYFEPLTLKKITLVKKDIDATFSEIFKEKTAANTEYAPKNWLNMLSTLSHDLRRYLVGEAIDNKDWAVQLQWLEVLRQRGLQDEFHSQLELLFKEIKTATKKHISDCSKGLLVAQYYRRHVFSESQKPDAIVLQECVRVIDDLMEVIHWKNACDQLNVIKMNMKKEHPNGAAVSVSARLPGQGRTSADFPLLSLYREVYGMLSTEALPYYERTKQLFSEYANTLDAGEMHGILRYLHNYAAVQSRKNNPQLEPLNMHELNVLADNKHLFREPGILTRREFCNVINVACAVQKFGWAHQFINNHKDEMPAEFSAKTVLLGEAIIAFAKKEYQKVLKLLDKVSFTDTHEVIRSKMLMIQSAYELNDYVTVSEHIVSLNRTLKDKNSTEPVTGALAFVKCVKMLINNKLEQAILIKYIDNAAHIYMKPWLREKVNAYKTGMPISTNTPDGIPVGLA